MCHVHNHTIYYRHIRNTPQSYIPSHITHIMNIQHTYPILPDLTDTIQMPIQMHPPMDHMNTSRFPHISTHILYSLFSITLFSGHRHTYHTSASIHQTLHKHSKQVINTHIPFIQPTNTISLTAAHESFHSP